jgi:hypothetical protein
MSGDSLKLIKPESKKISIEKNKIIAENYPIFCFKYLVSNSYNKCKNPKFFIEFLSRLQKLSELGWNEIRKSPRHGFGMEKIPVKNIKPKLPNCITPDVTHLHVFRATGDNLPFIGIEVQEIFRIIFIETKFGDIYKH